MSVAAVGSLPVALSERGAFQCSRPAPLRIWPILGVEQASSTPIESGSTSVSVLRIQLLE
jgi:hypothetical protein